MSFLGDVSVCQSIVWPHVWGAELYSLEKGLYCRLVLWGWPCSDCVHLRWVWAHLFPVEDVAKPGDFRHPQLALLLRQGDAVFLGPV